MREITESLAQLSQGGNSSTTNPQNESKTVSDPKDGATSGASQDKRPSSHGEAARMATDGAQSGENEPSLGEEESSTSFLFFDCDEDDDSQLEMLELQTLEESKARQAALDEAIRKRMTMAKIGKADKRFVRKDDIYIYIPENYI